MNIDKGLKRLLPADDQQNEEVNDKEIEKDNILTIGISADNDIIVDDKTLSFAALQHQLQTFIKSKKQAHVIKIDADGKCNYDTYFRLQNTLMITYRKLRNDYLTAKYGTTLTTCTERQLEEVFEIYPQRITEDTNTTKGAGL